MIFIFFVFPFQVMLFFFYDNENDKYVDLRFRENIVAVYGETVLFPEGIR